MLQSRKRSSAWALVEGSRARKANGSHLNCTVLGKVCECLEKAGQAGNALSVQTWHWSDLGREVVDFVVQLSGGLIQKRALLGTAGVIFWWFRGNS